MYGFLAYDAGRITGNPELDPKRLIGRPIKSNIKRKYFDVGERPGLFSAFSPDDLFARRL